MVINLMKKLRLKKLPGYKYFLETAEPFCSNYVSTLNKIFSDV
jgi:hypothetical protein